MSSARSAARSKVKAIRPLFWQHERFHQYCVVRGLLCREKIRAFFKRVLINLDQYKRPSAKPDGDISDLSKGVVMALTVSAASTADHVPTTPSPPAAALPRPTQLAAAKPSTGSSGQQTASLNRLLGLYRRDQANGAAANVLSGLGKQILAAAKAAGQHVTLPQASSNVSAAPAATVASSPSDTGKVNVTA